MNESRIITIKEKMLDDEYEQKLLHRSYWDSYGQSYFFYMLPIVLIILVDKAIEGYFDFLLICFTHVELSLICYLLYRHDVREIKKLNFEYQEQILKLKKRVMCYSLYIYHLLLGFFLYKGEQGVLGFITYTVVSYTLAYFTTMRNSLRFSVDGNYFSLPWMEQGGMFFEVSSK